MPTIPLLPTPGALPDAPNPVLNRNQYPEDNQAPVLQGLQRLGNADQLSLMDPEAMAKPYEKLGAIGEAIAQTGSVVGALAKKSLDAQTDWQVGDADGKMTQTRSAYQTWKASNPDPSTWGEEQQRRMQALDTELMSNDKLTPDARQQIRLRLQRFGAQWETENTASTAKQNFALARNAYLNVANQAIQDQDEEKFNAAVADAEKKQLFFPAVGQALKKDYTTVGDQQKAKAAADAERLQVRAAEAQATNDPQAWLAANAKPWQGQKQMWTALRGKALGSLQVNSAAAALDLNNQIANGDIVGEKGIEDFATANKFVTPQMKIAALEQIERVNEIKQRWDRDQYGIVNGVAMKQKIATMDPAQDPGMRQYYNALSYIRTNVDPGMGSDLYNRLNAKYGIDLAPPKPDPANVEYAKNEIARIFDPEHGAIPWRKAIAQTSGAGPIDPDADGAGPTPIAFTYQEDQQKRKNALIAEAQVTKTVNAYLANHPNASISEVSKTVNGSVSDGLLQAAAVNAAAAFRRTAPPAGPAGPAPSSEAKPGDDGPSEIEPGEEESSPDADSATAESGEEDSN